MSENGKVEPPPIVTPKGPKCPHCREELELRGKPFRVGPVEGVMFFCAGCRYLIPAGSVLVLGVLQSKIAVPELERPSGIVIP